MRIRQGGIACLGSNLVAAFQQDVVIQLVDCDVTISINYRLVKLLTKLSKLLLDLYLILLDLPVILFELFTSPITLFSKEHEKFA